MQIHFDKFPLLSPPQSTDPESLPLSDSLQGGGGGGRAIKKHAGGLCFAVINSMFFEMNIGIWLFFSCVLLFLVI